MGRNKSLTVRMMYLILSEKPSVSCSSQVPKIDGVYFAGIVEGGQG